MMLTPAEHARADAFERWLKGDHEANHPPVQLSLLTDIGDTTTPANTRTYNAQVEHEVAA